jgi:hypothetical protein
MQKALKIIAGFYNPAAKPGLGQAAASLAREALEGVNLLYQADTNVSKRASATGRRTE